MPLASRQTDLPDGSTRAPRAAVRAALVASLLASLTAGCNRFFTGRPSRLLVPQHAADAPSHAADAPAAAPSDSPAPEPPHGTRGVLARNGWIRTLKRTGPAVEASPGHGVLRWRYPDLDDLIARPDLRAPDLRAWLDDRDPVVAANAAIALARLDDGSGIGQLAEAVRTPHLELPIRRAAAEALGTLGEPSPVESLRELIDQYAHEGGPGGDAAKHPVPELHAELIRGLARHVDPGDDFRFTAALRSPAAEVRLAAVEAWARGRHGPLPAEAIDLRADTDPRVRAAALACLARRRPPQALDYLTAALDDSDFQVRTAAIAALGEWGGEGARAALGPLLDDPGEVTRARAVSALAAAGEESAVLGAAADKSWRVRREVARSLASRPAGAAVAVARQLIEDPCSMVRQQTIASVARWPLEQAGPILLAAMGTTGYQSRKRASTALAALWEPAADFPYDGPAERRDEVLGRLERLLEAEIGVAPTVAAGPRTAAVRSGDASADAEAIARALDRLASDEVTLRRRAAGQLARLAEKHPLSAATTERLVSLTLAETDQLVCQSVLEAVADDPGEPAIRLAYAATRHVSPEVRRSACRHLAAHWGPNRNHAYVLMPLLDDESPTVVRAAVRALAAPGRLRDTGPIERLLLAREELVRLEAAIALCRLGDPAGPAALERLSYSGNHAVRREVAAAMGEIADPSFAPSLVRLLDDRHAIREAALEALPRVTGREVAAAPGERPLDTAERIESWKEWNRQPH